MSLADILALKNNAQLAALTTQVNERTTYGVYSGLTVSAQGSPNMTVAVATGTIYMANGTRYAPAANNALAITAADATNPRIDIVYVNSSGAISYLAGTAAASPSAPSVPDGGLKLAEISVPANDTTIETTQILDKRKLLGIGEWFAPTLLNSWALVSSGGYCEYMKDDRGVVYIRGYLTAGTVTDHTIIFTLPAGYRPKGYMMAPGIYPSNGQPRNFYMDSSGNIKISGSAGLSGGSNYAISVQFMAAN